MRTITTAILILLFASQLARAGVPETVAIGVDTGNLDPKIATEIQDGIAVRVLNGLGEVFSNITRTRIQLVPIPDAKVDGQIRDCDSDACLQDIAQNGIADLVVRVKVQAKKAAKKGKSDYVVSLIVARAYPAREVWRDQSDCKKCGIPEIILIASLVAGDIAEKIKIDAPPPPAPVPQPPVVAVAPAVPPPALILGPPSPAKPAQEAWSVPRYLSGSVLGAGLILVGVGGYLLHLNGQGTCDLATPKEHCPNKYNTKGLGLGLVTGGGIVAVAGFVGLTFYAHQDANTNLAVSFNGSSISVSGAY
jgi:hypothetical protein